MPLQSFWNRLWKAWLYTKAVVYIRISKAARKAIRRVGCFSWPCRCSYLDCSAVRGCIAAQSNIMGDRLRSGSLCAAERSLLWMCTSLRRAIMVAACWVWNSERILLIREIYCVEGVFSVARGGIHTHRTIHTIDKSTSVFKSIYSCDNLVMVINYKL